MKNTKTIYHFIIDQSGSMSGMEEQTIAGFNEQLKTLKELQIEYPDQKYLISLTLFDSQVNRIINNGNVGQLEDLNPGFYRPNGSTALLDAIGKAIYDIKTDFGQQINNNEASVVVVILTDGYENASRLYSYHDVAYLIKQLDETGKWTFSFLGADFDAIHTSQMLNIRRENVMNFDKSDYMNMMNDVSASIRNYASEKSSGNLKRDIFDIFRDKERRKK